MGHWEPIRRDHAEGLSRQAQLPRWRLALHQHGSAGIAAAGWVGLVAMGLWAVLR